MIVPSPGNLAGVSSSLALYLPIRRDNKMPAPTAVLRDIHDLGLDPRFPHAVTGKDGRIAMAPMSVNETPMAEIAEIPEEKPQPVVAITVIKPHKVENVTVVASSKKNKVPTKSVV
jgi:hypothetical protein